VDTLTILKSPEISIEIGKLVMKQTKLFKDTTGGFLGLGNVTKLRSNPFGFLLELAQTQGGIAFFRFGPLGDFYLVTDPEYIREILVKQTAKTVKWERLTSASNKVAKFNIVFLEGEPWKSQRKLLAPAFHTQRVRAYLDLIHNHTLGMTDRWESEAVYDIRHMMADVTMGIIGEILFGIQDIQREASSLSAALDILLSQFITDAGSLFVMPKWVPSKSHRQAQKAKMIIVTYLSEIIRRRRSEAVDHGDVLSALMLARDEKTGEALTNEQIGDELYSLFVAGHETTALWLSWALYLLAKHPDIQAQLYDEINRTTGDVAPLMSAMGDMSLLNRVLQETLRMYPPAWSLFMRRVIEDIQLDTLVIPRGGIIYISPYVQHHLPQYWSNPDAFDPSRFEGDWKSERPAYAFMPFGGGPRVCLGSYLAEVEAKIILQTIIKHYSVSLLASEQEVFMNGGFTLRPYPHLQLCVYQRMGK
jgi:cytochrome P450